MLGADPVRAGCPCLGKREVDGMSRLGGESLEHRRSSLRLDAAWLDARLAVQARVLLVHRLLTDTKEEGDLLPRPAEPAGVRHLQRLKPLGQLAQLPRGLQAGCGVGAARRLRKSQFLTHAVNIC